MIEIEEVVVDSKGELIVHVAHGRRSGNTESLSGLKHVYSSDHSAMENNTRTTQSLLPPPQ
ncbi:hypothetical protein PENSPDRAFT_655985 [Peniophora sp. CONT]|nr:hypothetical protein PENSPDRAFT_655985 [Peniophora sp. CONT]